MPTYTHGPIGHATEQARPSDVADDPAAAADYNTRTGEQRQARDKKQGRVRIQAGQDEGLLRNLRSRFFGRPAHRLMEETEHVPFLARILTVAQSLAVVLVLGHSEVPLLLGASLAVRVLVGMALGVLIVTVVAADYCLIKTMQRVPVLARRNQWASVTAYMAYALFVGLVEISTYAVVLYILDRDPQALLQPTPLLPTAGLIFIAQVVLRAALIFWTMVQLFLTARKLPVQPNTLTDHSAELLGGKALELISELNTEHADLPMIFQAYAASVETTVRGTGGLLGWGLFRKRADAAASARRQQWTDLIATLRQFSTTRRDDPEGATPVPDHFTYQRRSAGRSTEVQVRLDQAQSALEQRREFMERRNVHGAKLDGVEGDWLGASDMRRIVRRDIDGKPCLGETRARRMVQAIGKEKMKVGGRMMYVASFDDVMRALTQAGMLDAETLSWWKSYSAAAQPPAIDSGGD
ncbi:MAG: hypothetical protein ACLQUY_25860 [Ktedonobacterales bacterium]